MKTITITILSLILLWTASSFKHIDKNDFPAYLIYTSNGKQTSFSKMLKTVYEADIVLVGELHDNPISHWMELQLTKALKERNDRTLVLGAEMFESDNQLILNEYLKGTIKESNFVKEMRLWSNYETDYRPLVEFAKTNKLEFIATNIPRRYASIVFNRGFEGLDSLSDLAKSYISPLPIKYDENLPSYKEIKKAFGDHGGDNLPKAQAVKDATMAYHILKNWKATSCFLHFNGAYHSDNNEGIVWYLKQMQPELKIVTLSTVLQNDLSVLDEEKKGRADFILCVNSDMTSTH